MGIAEECSDNTAQQRDEPPPQKFAAGKEYNGRQIAKHAFATGWRNQVQQIVYSGFTPLTKKLTP
jgi:hypothetical protein